MHEHKDSSQETSHIEILIHIACRGELTWVAHMTGEIPQRAPRSINVFWFEGFLPEGYGPSRRMLRSAVGVLAITPIEILGYYL